jgi:hypothetical protein
VIFDVFAGARFARKPQEETAALKKKQPRSNSAAGGEPFSGDLAAQQQ